MRRKGGREGGGEEEDRRKRKRRNEGRLGIWREEREGVREREVCT